MTPKILGLHHVTATVDDAQADLDFCLELLGMRLVKKTVNFDNHDVYHFYYGTERGAPAPSGRRSPTRATACASGVKGAGQVVTTSFSVPAASIGFWRERLKDRGVDARTSRPASAKRSSASPIRPGCRSSWSRATRRADAVDRQRRRRGRSDPRAAQRDDDWSRSLAQRSS